MKLTYIVLAVFFIGSITTLNAQQEYFEYGFKGGVNIAQMTGDVPASYESRTSMKIGAFGIYKILPKLGIQAELLYSEQGFSNEPVPETIAIEKIEELLRMQYVNLPVLASYNLVENLWLEGGMQVGYLVKAVEDREEVRLINQGEVTSETTSTAKTDNYERIDFGLAGGLRYKLSQNFMVQARFHQSLNDVDKSSEGDQYHRVYSFSIGYVF
ncbi:PorT family protein [Psychroflexus sp. YR1-1]|uniref:PorT family protein n=1 Tax=Psychroflexus aurantiacus TaxID=2709310 RepID=A0A6B3R5E2_9FLAO|nr:porin family protein [Psychroflexus aurantiacus]NEV92594.1 PorT family protein [Psychroflexus aurantiacus]